MEFEYDGLNEEYEYKDHEWNIRISEWNMHAVTIINRYNRGWLINESFSDLELAFDFCRSVVKFKEDIKRR